MNSTFKDDGLENRKLAKIRATSTVTVNDRITKPKRNITQTQSLKRPKGLVEALRVELRMQETRADLQMFKNDSLVPTLGLQFFIAPHYKSHYRT